MKVSVSGIRGIVGEDVTPDIVTRLAASYGLFCNSGKIVVGRDTRLSGPMMAHAVLSGLVSVGCKVIHLGIETTPTIQLAVKHFDADGGIAITASHNPSEWNALKLMDKDGMFISQDEVFAVFEGAQSGNHISWANHSDMLKISRVSQFDKVHIQSITDLNIINADQIRERKLKVVVDCVNGAASRIVPKLLDHLGCDVIKLNCKGNGDFSRGTEPLPENLSEIGHSIRKKKADLGLAFDPDGDRLAILDEKGRPIGEDLTLVLVARLMLAYKRSCIVTNLSTTAAIDHVAAQFGSKVHRCKIGAAYVVDMMIETGCSIGGEGNGGVMFQELHYIRDAVAAAAHILQLITESGKTMSKLVAEIPEYHMVKHKCALGGHDLKDVYASARKMTSGAEIDESDGIKIIFKNSWVHLRPSGTEPVVRVISEAATREKAEEMAKRYAALMS